jgi:hypothetical protein
VFVASGRQQDRGLKKPGKAREGSLFWTTWLLLDK